MPQQKRNRSRTRSAPSRTKRRAPATARVSVSLGKDLLAHATRFARDHRTTVAALLSEGLKKLTEFAREPVLPPGNLVTQPAAPALEGWDQMLAWMEEHQSTLTQIRDAIGDVAASLPADPPAPHRPPEEKRIPPL